MGRRIKAYKINKKYLFIGVAIAIVSLGIVLVTSLALTSCRNPLMNIIESSGITVRVDGKTIQPGGMYDLGRVKQGGGYSKLFTIQNSGNVSLKLIGDPPVGIIADPATAGMFDISPAPSNLIQVRGSTDFTLVYNPLGVDVERTVQLLIKNNSKQQDFVFDLTSLVDGTAPTVKETSGVPQVYPANNDTNISTNVTVSATFSEAVNPDTITTTSYTLTKDGAATPLVATVSYNSTTDTAFLSPISLLEDFTEYHAELSNTIADLVGNSMVLNYSWSFITGTGIVDSEPPTVASTVPANLAESVALNSVITATFNEPLDSSTAENIDNFIVTGTTPVTGTVNYDNPSRTITFTPDALASLTNYTAQLTVGIRDVAQNPLATYEWSFTTELGVDVTGPTVVGRNPLSGATGVPTNTVITAEFDELVDPLTVNNTTFSLTQYLGPNPGAVSGTVTYNAFSKTAIFTPDADLDDNAEYSVELTSGIEDISGNPLQSQPVWTFAAAAAADTTAPTVVSTDPSDGVTGVLLYGNITATFSESMNPSTINDTTFELFQGANQIAGIVSYSEATKTATFNPSPLLDETTDYTAKVISGPSGVKDSAGNPLAADKVWTFTTEAGTTNPIVIEATLDPLKNAVDVDIAITTIEVEFSKMMDPLTITASTFLVSEDATGNPVTATSVSYDETSRVATFTLGSSLNYSTLYEVECTNGMEDIGSNPLIAFSYYFTTIPDNLWDTMKWDVGKWAP